MKQITDVINQVQTILGATPRVFAVGGCVRDAVLCIDPQDIDLEVFGISFDEITKCLSDSGITFGIHGNQFPVIKAIVDDTHVDISVPRRERKVDIGRTGFHIDVDPDMSIENALARRDFTMNAMLMDASGNIIDPFGGKDDLASGILRHTSNRFVEDTTRVLRGMQFCARFKLTACEETLSICNDMLPEFDAIERDMIHVEFVKMFCAPHPSFGMKFLRDSGFIVKFPELQQLTGIVQDKKHHPEGDVFEHTTQVMDAMAQIVRNHGIEDKKHIVKLMVSAMCHDLGKVFTTVIHEDGSVTSRGHANAGVQPARQLIARIFNSQDVTEFAVEMTDLHMAFVDEPTKKSVRRIANKMKHDIRDLALVIQADKSGRTDGGFSHLVDCAVVNMVFNMEDEVEVVPLINGHDLIDMGLKPGKVFSQIINAVVEKQIEEEITDRDAAIAFVINIITNNN